MLILQELQEITGDRAMPEYHAAEIQNCTIMYSTLDYQKIMHVLGPRM